MQVDHGGFQSGMSQQFLKLADGYARLQQVAGVAVAQQVRVHAAGDLGCIGGLPKIAAGNFGQWVPSTAFAGGVAERTRSAKDMLPFPRTVGTGQLVRQGEGQLDAGPVGRQIALPKQLAVDQVLLQRGFEGFGERDLPVLVSLATANHQGATSKVQVLDSQLEKFGQAQPAAILEPEEQLPGRYTGRKQFEYRLARQDLGQTPNVVGTPLLERQLQTQNFADQPNQCVASLGEGRGGDSVLQDQPVQEGLDNLRGRGRIPGDGVAAFGQSLRPIQISLAGPVAVVLGTELGIQCLQNPRPFLDWISGAFLDQGDPKSERLMSLMALPIRIARAPKFGGECLGRVSGRPIGRRGYPFLNPSLVMGMEPRRDSMALQERPVVVPHLEVRTRGVLGCAKRGIYHTTENCAKTGSWQGDLVGDGPRKRPFMRRISHKREAGERTGAGTWEHESSFMRNAPHKQEFPLITLLGRPSGRDIVTISNKYIAANASHGILNTNYKTQSCKIITEQPSNKIQAQPAYGRLGLDLLVCLA